MAAQNKQKLTKTFLDKWVQTVGKGAVVYDTEINNFYAVKNSDLTASFKYNYRNSEGKPKKYTCRLKFPNMSVEMARREINEAVGEIAKGLDPNEQKKEARKVEAKQCTLGEYVEGDYTAYQLRYKKSGRTTLAYLKKNFGAWYNKPMTEINPALVNQWEACQTIAFDTYSRYFGALKTCLTHAEGAGVIDENRIKQHKLTRPPVSKADIERENLKRAQRRPLTSSEIKGLMKGLDLYDEEVRATLPEPLREQFFADALRPYILIMFYTGFRNGDVNTLSWNEIEWSSKRIVKLLNKTAHHASKRPDVFPIAKPLLPILEAWYKQNGSPKSGYVFPNLHHRDGHIEDWAEDKRRWGRVKELGGIDSKLVLYTLRHHLPSTLLARGESVFIVSKLLGHSDIKTTIKHYAHLIPDDAASVVDRYSDLMDVAISG